MANVMDVMLRLDRSWGKERQIEFLINTFLQIKDKNISL